MKLIKKAKLYVLNKINNYKVIPYLKESSNRATKGSEIKIAFIVQMPEIWDKQCMIYEKMKVTEGMEADLIVVPSYDFERNVMKEYGEERKYFVERYGKVINAITDKGIISLKEYDYVFYQRPYDHYLPQELRSGEVVKYAKVCYIPYGYIGAKVFNNSLYTSFFRNVYIGFMDSSEECEKLNKKFKSSIKKGYQHFCDLGYPVLEQYMGVKINNTVRNILWTPRWSYTGNIGGSHFIEYKDEILTLENKFTNLNVVIRPHPLTFSNMIKEGKMTEKEVEEYKKKLSESGVQLDSHEMIEDTLKETDILITDFSSIMIMYFLTGRPMIFCNSNYEFSRSYKKMLEGVYIANSWSDIEKYVKCISEGNDYLREVREKIIREEFANIKGATDKIVKYIVEDSKK